jgi:hypothetical protein
MSNIALLAGLISGTMVFFVLYVGLQLFKLYKKKKNKTSLYLCLSIFSYLFTILSATIVYLCTGFSNTIGLIFQKGIYLGVFLSMMLTFLFASNIFFTPTRLQSSIYYIIGVISILILTIFDSSIISEFPDDSEYPLILLKIEYGILLVAYILPTSLGIYIAGMRVSKRTEDKMFRKSFRYISIGNLMVPLTFIFDTISTTFINNVFVYSLFLYLTWIPPVIATFLYYKGYTLPYKEKKEQ